MNALPRFLAIASALGLASVALRATNYEYDNSAPWVYANGGNGQAPFIQPFNDPNVFAVGQTFRLLPGTLGVTSVSLWVNTPASNSLDLRLYLAEWDTGNARMGAMLQQWIGPDHILGVSYPNTAAGFLNFKFDSDIPVPVDSLKSYILLATVNDLAPADPATAKFGFFPGAHFPDGSAVLGWGSSLGDLTERSWTSLDGDLAFSVAFFDRTTPFTPVPEPSLMGEVAAVGLFGLLMNRVLRRRKKMGSV